MTRCSYSKKDIRSLKVFYKICNILAAAPPYDFDKKDTRKTFWKKFQGALLIFLIIVGTVYSIYIRQKFYTSVYTLTHLVLDYLDEFFIVTFAFTVICDSCFCNPNKWVQMNNNLQYIDEVLKNRNTREKNVLRNVTFQFFLYATLYICAVIVLLYVWLQEMGLVALQAYSVHQTCMFYVIFLHFLIYNLALGLKSRYDDLNKLFQVEKHEYWEKNLIATLRKIGGTSQRLSETVDLFNDIFGTCLILITGKSIVQLLTCLNFITNNLKSEHEDFKEKLFTSNLCLVIYTSVSVSLVMVTCDCCTMASRQTASLCYKLQEQVTDSEVRDEVLKLAQHVSANVAHITAGNYFDINKATLCGIFGTTTTYFIVILQFNQSMNK